MLPLLIMLYIYVEFLTRAQHCQRLHSHYSYDSIFYALRHSRETLTEDWDRVLDEFQPLRQEEEERNEEVQPQRANDFCRIWVTETLMGPLTSIVWEKNTIEVNGDQQFLGYQHSSKYRFKKTEIHTVLEQHKGVNGMGGGVTELCL